MKNSFTGCGKRSWNSSASWRKNSKIAKLSEKYPQILPVDHKKKVAKFTKQKKEHVQSVAIKKKRIFSQSVAVKSSKIYQIDIWKIFFNQSQAEKVKFISRSLERKIKSIIDQSQKKKIILQFVTIKSGQSIEGKLTFVDWSWTVLQFLSISHRKILRNSSICD